jgi:hypothetical protein
MRFGERRDSGQPYCLGARTVECNRRQPVEHGWVASALQEYLREGHGTGRDAGVGVQRRPQRRVERPLVGDGLERPDSREARCGALLHAANDGHEALHRARTNHGQAGDCRFAGGCARRRQVGGQRLD